MQDLIDSHCHLTYDDFSGRIDEVIARANAAGVAEMVTIATDLQDAAKALDLSRRYKCVHVVAGVHPHQAGAAAEGWDAELTEIHKHQVTYAVGETGLDYHYDFADRPTQRRIFELHLEIARSTGKPVVIHCREAHADVMSTLAGFPNLSGVVFHCFTGTMAEAEEIWARGYWLSLTGVVTFKRSTELREVAKVMPADRLMIETDSPYLSPEPLRSVRPNEPAHVVHVATCIAAARGMDVDALADLSAANTRRFFRLPSAG